jgi:hypothetical protein
VVAAVPPAFRPVLQQVTEARSQLAELCRDRPPGPLRDRAVAMVDRVNVLVDECLAAAGRAAEIDRLLETVDPAAITADYKRARREADVQERSGGVPSELALSVASLRRQHESAQRLLNGRDAAIESIGLVGHRMRELLLAMAELNLAGGESDQLALVEGQVAGVAEEVRALRDTMASLGPSPA